MEYVKNKDLINSYLTTKDGKTYTSADLTLMFPARFENIHLLEIKKNQLTTICFVCLIDNHGNYANIIAPIQATFFYNEINKTTINDIEYYTASIPKGNYVIPNISSIVSSKILLPIFKEFYIRGKIPWYLSYDEINKLFSETTKYANRNIGNNAVIFEIFTAVISRLKQDKKIQVRYYPNQKSQVHYVGLENPYYSYDNTGAKLIGNRFEAGLTAAIIEPETKNTKVLDVLRS